MNRSNQTTKGRILLTAKHPPAGKLSIGGVQSWCATVADELNRTGWHVVCWGPELPLPTQKFDLGIFANTQHTRQAMTLCDQVAVVSHGIIPDEKPDPADLQFFTSEEVRHHWKLSGQIIRQPLDLTIWTPHRLENCPPNSHLLENFSAPHRKTDRPHLTRFSYRHGLDFLPALAQERRYTFRHLSNSSRKEVIETLRGSALVIATGRAAVEAMACGAEVVIADHRHHYQGPLLDFDTLGSMARNYSGRGGVVANHDNLQRSISQSLEKRDRHGPGWMRAHVEEHHDARKVVAQMLQQCGITPTNAEENQA